MNEFIYKVRNRNNPYIVGHSYLNKLNETEEVNVAHKGGGSILQVIREAENLVSKNESRMLTIVLVGLENSIR